MLRNVTICRIGACASPVSRLDRPQRAIRTAILQGVP